MGSLSCGLDRWLHKLSSFVTFLLIGLFLSSPFAVAVGRHLTLCRLRSWYIIFPPQHSVIRRNNVARSLLGNCYKQQVRLGILEIV
ncbi:hypothetical protein ATANTOWER_029751, partial [Ataeniobius toweri]|nr:hypothetical protein [Ataeniobius toweri]